MRRVFHSPEVVSDTPRNISYAETLKRLRNAKEINWEKEEEGGFNLGYWPMANRPRMTRGKSFSLIGSRRSASFRDIYGVKSLVIPGETAVYYHGTEEPLLVTFGDTPYSDAYRTNSRVQRVDTAIKVISFLDNYFEGRMPTSTQGKELEYMLFTAKGVAFGKEAWDRTINGLKKAYEILVDMAVTQKSEEAVRRGKNTLWPEAVGEAYHKLKFEEFLSWAESKGLDPREVSASFINIVSETEDSLFSALGMEDSKLITRLSTTKL